MPANFSAVSENEMTYVMGGSVADYLAPAMGAAQWQNFHKNLITIVVRTPLPMSTIRYRLPQRTTLLLPEEPEYNEMNSAMKNLLLLMKTARRRIRQAVGFVQTCCGYRACSSAAGTRSTLLMSAPRPRSFSTMFS